MGGNCRDCFLDCRVWLSGSQAAAYIGRSRDSIEKRALPWQDEYVEKRVRWVWSELDVDGEVERRYYKPDLDKLFKLPPGSRSKILPFN